MKQTPIRAFGLALVLLSPISCWASTTEEAGDVPEPTATFDMATFREVDLALQVESDMPGVQITVQDTRAASSNSDDSRDQSGETFYQGLTGATGRLRASFRVPARVDEVDVILHQPGFTGPWTDEALRAEAGPFAPSARIRVDADSLIALTVALEEK